MAMPCPTCGAAKTSVKETRGTRRTRTCRACGEVFGTLEISEAAFGELREWRERYRSIVEAVDLLMTAPIPEDDDET